MKLVINLDTGVYSYTPAGNTSNVTSEFFNYTVKDFDSDTASARHEIRIVPPGGVDDGGLSTTQIDGSDLNDQITLLHPTLDQKTYYLQLGGGPNGPSASSVTTETVNQIIDAKGGNDYVEGGRGADTIYMGDSGNNNYPGTGVAPTQANVQATNLMQLADGAILQAADGTFTAQARYTSSSNTLSAAEWSDLANAGEGDDTVYGQGGVDMIYGGAGNDKLHGGAGIDGLRGGAGDDLIVGGAGNDVMRGDAGVDTFQWSLADAGTTAAPARDVILDFNAANPSSGGDILDLRDLLSGPANSTVGQLDNYLHFEVAGGNTTIYVSATGAFSDANNATKSGSSPANVLNNDVQQIVLQNVDLVGGSTTDQQVIANLLANGKLLTD